MELISAELIGNVVIKEGMMSENKQEIGRVAVAKSGQAAQVAQGDGSDSTPITAKEDRGLVIAEDLRFCSSGKARRIVKQLGILTNILGRLRRDLNAPRLRLTGRRKVRLEMSCGPIRRVVDGMCRNDKEEEKMK